jgi:tRNA(fMet)-specific endonuclease VapC
MACLDTDFLVAYLRKDLAAKRKLEELESEQEPLHTTIINAFELYKGAYKSKDPKAELAKVDALLDAFFLLAFYRNSVKDAGALNDELNPIGKYDLLIASIALVNKQTLITRNKKYFERIFGLQLEGW